MSVTSSCCYWSYLKNPSFNSLCPVGKRANTNRISVSSDHVSNPRIILGNHSALGKLLDWKSWIYTATSGTFRDGCLSDHKRFCNLGDISSSRHDGTYQKLNSSASWQNNRRANQKRHVCRVLFCIFTLHLSLFLIYYRALWFVKLFLFFLFFFFALKLALL